jgi:hypothetical protein
MADLNRFAQPRAAYTIPEFCAAHGICRATLANLWKSGQGPKFMQIRARRYISAEAAEEFRRAVEKDPADAR